MPYHLNLNLLFVHHSFNQRITLLLRHYKATQMKSNTKHNFTATECIFKSTRKYISHSNYVIGNKMCGFSTVTAGRSFLSHVVFKDHISLEL